MTNPTYQTLRKQIAALEAQAAKIKSQEVADVVGRIKEAIAAYGLTTQDLFGGKAAAAKRAKPAKAARAQGKQYSDGQGGFWGGRGKRPQWLASALAAGRQLEEFLVGAMTPAAAPAAAPARKAKAVKAAAAKKPAKKAAAKAAAAAKYTDGTGRTWTGRGRQPQWFKDALAAGKKPEDLQA
ncbi:MAG: H-NS histone family protein [Burkholderiales bacterium]|nr:H-NS histone family protein [Burkholderiales bacterium]